MSSSDLGWAFDSRKPNYSALNASTTAASLLVKVSLTHLWFSFSALASSSAWQLSDSSYTST